MSARPGPRVGLLALLVLAACGPTDQPLLDSDGDGSPDAADCAPQDPSIYPFAPDPWGDEVDQDCDGADGVDADGDGYPAPGEGTENTEVDCDDARPDVHPHATEIPDNGVDEDCDGADGAGTTPGDFDNDGTPDEEDCDPEDPALNEEDADGDGFTSCGGDCDDTDPDRYPQGGWEDPWDGVDSDCDDVDGTALETARAILTGEQTEEWAGSAVAAGDLDGDGLGDLLVGAPRYGDGGGSGRKALFLGSQLVAGGTLALSQAHAVIIWTGGASSGSPQVFLGDLDGDGLAEVAVGPPSEGGWDDGVAYVLWGASLQAGGELVVDDALAILVGEAPMDVGGSQLVLVGDLDGDGLGELAMALPRDDRGAPDGGAVWVMPGSALGAGGLIPLAEMATVFACAEENAECGTRLVAPGDVDGDGLPDLLVGAPQWGAESTPTEMGRLFLLSGEQLAAGGELSEAEAHATLRHPDAESMASLGLDFCGLGDLDGDGRQDLAVGGQMESALGPRIVLGSQLEDGGEFDLALAHATVELYDLDGNGEATDWATVPISGPGDLDGDGIPELLVGPPGYSAPGAPLAWVLPGATLVAGGVVPLTTATAVFHRTAAETSPALTLHPAGDVDGDGRPDLVFAAPGDDTVETDAGRAWLMLSP